MHIVYGQLTDLILPLNNSSKKKKHIIIIKIEQRFIVKTSVRGQRKILSMAIFDWILD